MNHELKHCQKILWRNSKREKWKQGIFSHYNHNLVFVYSISGGKISKYCIPYKGNEHLEGVRGRQNLINKGESAI
jgi:hypothetical protein